MVSRVTGMPYEQAVKRYLFNPIGMTSGSVSMAGLESNRSWARPHSVGPRPLPIVDTYYKVPGAGGVNSNIKDMALWMLAQMGEMPDVLDGQGARHDPRALRGHAERARTAAQVPRAARRPPGTAMAGAATIMPGTTSSATAAGSTATAR